MVLRFTVALALLSTSPALAQTPQGTISGIVTDTTGAIVPGTSVSAVHSDTGQRTATVTNTRGFFVLTQLAIGTYVIEAELSGFQKYHREGLLVTTGATIALDIQLTLGDLRDTVTVSAEAPLLQARTSDVSQLIEARSVQDLPLGDRRSMNLINMIGGAVFVQYDAGTKPNFSLAGGRTQSQMFWIDGGTGQNMRLGIGQMDLDPPVETVQEVKVLASTYAAEYGGSAGGVIIATTKSGTNTLRGSASEYFRDDALDATNFFAPVVNGEKSKPPLRYNVFGGTAGGPVRRDRTFFFFGYEGSRRTDGSTSILTVPTELQRRGDFSQTFDARGAVIPVFDPATTVGSGAAAARTQLPGNVIPADRLDPVALKILAVYPQPNRAPDSITGANNFSGNFAQQLVRDNYTIRLDHNVSATDRLSARYLYNSDNLDFTSVFNERAADTNQAALRHQNYWYGGYTRTFASNLVNELRYTYSNRINHQFAYGVGDPWPSKLGLKGVADEAFPRITVAGMASIGAASHERRQFPIEQHQIINTTSYVRGRHALKGGFEIRPSFNYEINRPSISGTFAFTTQPTAFPNRAGTGLGLASLLLGFPNSVTVRETEALDRSSWYLAAFAQDDWTVSANLTLNVGVRWETDTPIVDSDDRMNGFDPDAINPVSGTPGVVRFAGVDGWPSSPYRTDWNNVGPRAGFAWRPFGAAHTIVRGGFGVSFAHPFDHGAPNSASLGFERSASLQTPDNGITAPFYLRDGVPQLQEAAVVRDAAFGAVRVGQNPTTAVTYYERDRATGYAQQFNLGVQRELPAQFIVEVSYLGNLSRKLPSQSLSINQIAPAKMAAGLTAQRDRPFPQFSNVMVLFPTLGVSNYHAGVLRVERRFAHGFNVLSTYTWSRFLNNTDEGGANIGDPGVYSDFYNRSGDYGPSANDIRHRATFSSVWELPIGTGRRWLSSGWLAPVVGNWSVGMLGTLQSGPPFTVTTQTNSTNAQSAGPLRADLMGDPELPSDERTLARWFNTDAFAQPAPLRFGTSGRGILRGDGIVKFDLLIGKQVALGAHRMLQFRVELFNAFNHTDFGLPGHTFGAPGFGIVSSARAPRSMQLGLRFAY
jgi:hypothetical protein